MHGSTISSTEAPQVWTPARVYTAYRIFLAALLLVFFLADQDAPLVGRNDPDLFLYTSIFYLILVILPALLPAPRRELRFAGLIPISIDIVVLAILVHASGGINSNLTVLLLVAVAAGSILLPGRMGLLVAAMATITVMFEQFYFSLAASTENPFQLTESALLGIAFFAVSLITQQVAQRLARSESLAASQRLAISRLEAINQQVVARMRTGVLVFDSNLQVVLFNRSAEQLFERGLNNQRLPQAVLEGYRAWRRNPAQHRPPVIVSPQAPAQDIGFADLGGEGLGLCIAFIEDRSKVLQHAQQIKLASLGRMSATIAHEIRNPLSAIHHAAELLEDTNQSSQDQRLLSIIRSHVGRVNEIIYNVLELSRRNHSQAEELDIRVFLDDCRSRWREQSLPLDNIRIHCPDQDLILRFDGSQLKQVVDNLVNNALRHGGDVEDPRVEIRVGSHPDTQLPWLEVRDFGPGVSDAARDSLFEPFFTTSRDGTGLGLFICRELCEANQARLDYLQADPGSRFVITFSHPDRVFQ